MFLRPIAMKFLMYLTEVFVRNVRVHLCSRDVLVPEELLDTPQVCTMAEEIGRIGVSQCVWRDFL